MSIKPYLLSGLIILAWWTLAFNSAFGPPPQVVPPKQTLTEFPQTSVPLSRLRRDQLDRALAGNYTLMAKLIADWDVDAALLENQGLPSIARLSRDDMILSQALARDIRNTKKIDQDKYLPQTHVSATLLMALLPPEQIAGLPRGVYPPPQGDIIPPYIDRHHSELIHLIKPAAAFISPLYSHPAMLETLSRQAIKTIPLDAPITLKQLKATLEFLGKEVGRPNQAKLLCLFIDAAMMAIDNRLNMQGTIQKALYINHYSKYYFPSPTTITWDLLQRLGLKPEGAGVPMDLERLLNLNPEYLIISTDACPEPNRYLKAAQNGQIYHISDKIQQNPTQYAVLAYYDIAQALSQMGSP